MASRKDLEYKSLSEDGLEPGSKTVTNLDQKPIVIYARDILSEIETYESNKKKGKSPTPEVNKLKTFYADIKNKEDKLSGEELSELVKILIDTTPNEKSPKTLKVYEAIRAKFPTAFLDNMRQFDGWRFSDPIV